jgi:hypothetical protein
LDRERQDEKAQFRARNLHRFRAPDSPDFKRKFTRAYLYYIASIKGERRDERDDGSREDELSSAFNTLLVDIEDPEEQDSYFTSVETLFTTPDLQPPKLLNTASDLINNLINRSCTHLLTGENHTTESGKPPIEDTRTFTVGGMSRYNTNRFYGIVIDTGATKYSTTSLDQFQALQQTDNSIELDRSTEGSIKVKFGISTSSSLGSAIIDTPIRLIRFHIIPSKTPFLLSLADMDELKVYFNNLRN